MFRVSRDTVSKVKIASEKEKKTSSAKHKSGWKLKLSERDCWTLYQITSSLNERFLNLMFTKTVHREFYKGTFHGNVAIRKPFLSQINASKRLEWYMAHWNWSLEEWKRAIFSKQIVIFLISDNWPSLCLKRILWWSGVLFLSNQQGQ